MSRKARAGHPAPPLSCSQWGLTALASRCSACGPRRRFLLLGFPACASQPPFGHGGGPLRAQGAPLAELVGQLGDGLSWPLRLRCCGPAELRGPQIQTQHLGGARIQPREQHLRFHLTRVRQSSQALFAGHTPLRALNMRSLPLLVRFCRANRHPGIWRCQKVRKDDSVAHLRFSASSDDYMSAPSAAGST